MKIAVYSHVAEDSGIGRACLNHVQALRAFGSVDLYNAANFQNASPADVFYFHGLPSELIRLENSKLFSSARKVAYLVWESTMLPDYMIERAGLFDEIWTCSEFCKDIFSVLGIPVHVVPHFVTHYKAPVKRQDNVFKFLYTFDGGSRLIRKNPAQLISAFKTAFDKKDDSVSLTIKTKNLGESYLKYLQRLSLGHSVEILNGVLSYDETLELTLNSSCYVSPHKSEGFGLTLLEAMALGKLTVASAFGGNLDFMSKETSLLVDVDVKSVDDDFYKGEWGFPRDASLVKCLKSAREAKFDKKEAGFELALGWTMQKTIKLLCDIL